MSPVRLLLAITLGQLLGAPPILAGLGPSRVELRDLATLVAASEHIVLAERQATGAAQPDESVTYRVKRAFKGSFIAGSGLEISELGYDLQGGVLGGREGQPPQPLDSDVILFLGRSESSKRWVERHPLDLLVASRGKLYRPSRFRSDLAEPLPLGREGALDEPFEEPERVRPVSLAGFEVDLREAIARTEALEVCAARSDPVARRAGLLALLPPLGAPPPRCVLASLFDAGRDARAGSITFHKLVLLRIHAERDLDLLLEACARIGPWERWDDVLDGDLGSGHLLRALRETKMPAHRREAALRTADVSVGPRPETAAILLASLGDADAGVRRAAATAAGKLASLGGLEQDLQAGLVSAWKRESDAWVRLAIIEALRDTTAMGQLEPAGSLPRLVPAARFYPPFAEYSCQRSDGGMVTPQEIVCVAASRATGLERRTPPAVLLRSVLRSPYRTRWLRLAFDPPLEPGPHTMWLELRVESGGRLHALRTAPTDVTWLGTATPGNAGGG